jgi:alpha-1,6-mannosyltransferase
VTAALVLGAALTAWPGGSPLEPLHGGHPRGDSTWAWAFLFAAAAALVAYVAGWMLLRSRAVALGAVAAVAVAVQLAPLAGPLLLSTDAWTYWSYARLAAVHDENPYRAVPADEPDDPSFPYVGTAWRHTSSIYGPAFTLTSEPVGHTASADVAAWFFKASAALAMLLATLAAARVATNRAAAVAFVGWNPVVALHAAGGGHNDAWMAAFVTGALALGATGRRQLAGVAWALAIFVKWIPLLLLPLRVLQARQDGRRIGFAGFALAALAVAALASVRYGTGWLRALEPVARKAGEQTSFALPSRIAQLGVPRELAAALLAVAFVAAYAVLARQAAQGRPRLAMTSVLLLLATPWLVVWYLAWPVSLAGAEEDRTAQWLTVALSAYLLPQAIPL